MRVDEEELIKLRSQQNKSKAVYNNKISLVKNRLHKEHYLKNKKVYLLFDIAMIIMILLNFGALVMTNMLVLVVEPERELFEANPVNYVDENVKQHPEPVIATVLFVKQVVVWFILVAAYVWFRKTIFTNRAFWYLTFIVLWYFMVISFDFFNDLGFLIGKVLTGGLM